MYSLEYISKMSRQAAKETAKAHVQPYLIEQGDIESMPPFPFPFIGYRTPKHWRKTGREFFVDSSGFGQPGGIALTPTEFISKLQIGLGYALTEVGQFQVYVAEFEQI